MQDAALEIFVIGSCGKVPDLPKSVQWHGLWRSCKNWEERHILPYSNMQRILQEL